MAIISTLIGGICGFLAFVIAWLFFDVGLLPALGLYMIVGTGLTIALIIACLSWQALCKLSLVRVALRPYSVQSQSLSKPRS